MRKRANENDSTHMKSPNSSLPDFLRGDQMVSSPALIRGSNELMTMKLATFMPLETPNISPSSAKWNAAADLSRLAVLRWPSSTIVAQLDLARMTSTFWYGNPSSLPPSLPHIFRTTCALHSYQHPPPASLYLASRPLSVYQAAEPPDFRSSCTVQQKILYHDPSSRQPFSTPIPAVSLFSVFQVLLALREPTVPSVASLFFINTTSTPPPPPPRRPCLRPLLDSH
ncbi:hypothetical protein BDZ45DRAFT_752051 [Acephala macrosclerotiorum]|nr:hypothetical protein BDZ45DRAFT_752051 [Acephala macrosclerotiorum]